MDYEACAKSVFMLVVKYGTTGGTTFLMVCGNPCKSTAFEHRTLINTVSKQPAALLSSARDNLHIVHQYHSLPVGGWYFYRSPLKIVIRMDISYNYFDDNGLFHCNLLDFPLEKVELF